MKLRRFKEHFNLTTQPLKTALQNYITFVLLSPNFVDASKLWCRENYTNLLLLPFITTKLHNFQYCFITWDGRNCIHVSFVIAFIRKIKPLKYLGLFINDDIIATTTNNVTTNTTTTTTTTTIITTITTTTTTITNTISSSRSRINTLRN